MQKQQYDKSANYIQNGTNQRIELMSMLRMVHQSSQTKTTAHPSRYVVKTIGNIEGTQKCRYTANR